MTDKPQNQNNDSTNRNKGEETNPADPQGKLKPEYFEELPTEGGIRPANTDEPAKGGRFGNASVEDGGTVEGSSTGSH